MNDKIAVPMRWPIALSLLLLALVLAIAFGAALARYLLPRGDEVIGESRDVAAGVIFAGSHPALAIGSIAGLSIDGAGIALAGAVLMVLSGALPLQGAHKAVDLETIALLLGMMIVVASLRLSGFFAFATVWVMARARRSLILLTAMLATSGFFSAFLVNDEICLVLTPLVLDLTIALKRRPAGLILCVSPMRETRPVQGEGAESCPEQTSGD